MNALKSLFYDLQTRLSTVEADSSHVRKQIEEWAEMKKGWADKWKHFKGMGNHCGKDNWWSNRCPYRKDNTNDAPAENVKCASSQCQFKKNGNPN